MEVISETNFQSSNFSFSLISFKTQKHFLWESNLAHQSPAVSSLSTSGAGEQNKMLLVTLHGIELKLLRFLVILNARRDRGDKKLWFVSRWLKKHL